MYRDKLFKCLVSLAALCFSTSYKASSYCDTQGNCSKGCAISTYESFDLVTKNQIQVIQETSFKPQSCFAFTASPYTQFTFPFSLAQENIYNFNYYNFQNATRSINNFTQRVSLINDLKTPKLNITTPKAGGLPPDKVTIKIINDNNVSSNFYELNNNNFPDAFCNYYATFFYYHMLGQNAGYNNFSNYLKNKLGIQETAQGQLTVNQGNYFKAYVTTSTGANPNEKKYSPSAISAVNKTNIPYYLMKLTLSENDYNEIILSKYKNFLAFNDFLKNKNGSSNPNLYSEYDLNFMMFGTESPFYYPDSNSNCTNLSATAGVYDSFSKQNLPCQLNNVNNDAMSILCLEPQVFDKSKL